MAKTKETMLDILMQRIDKEDHISSWLFNEIQMIIKQSTNHLKYVTRAMPEFDLHDSSHSEAVVDIIESLLGAFLKKLSSFELFYLIGSAYLHDCGMAISDYEKRIMELTEGTCDRYVNNRSLKNDGKKCMTHAQASDFVRDNKHEIYQSFDGEIQNWLFVPSSENELIQYLSTLLVEYQEFRNKNYSIIKNCTDFESTNQALRVEYIRSTHHKRIAEYIRRWGKTRFSTFPVNGLGQRIANDLAAICEAHGENPEYMRGLGTQVEYCGYDSINLQFVAMLLRIGDIVHFDYDRAPVELRSLHQFESEYSLQQWKMKSGGVNQKISNGTISYRAFLTNPVDYYELYKYIDWIDDELSLFHQLSLKWEKKYHLTLKEKVDRSNITYDATIFTPALGLKFSLNQRRILDLLKGVGLYKNKLACIRELYQNSLDACRCQIAKDKANGKQSKGRIEFGIGEDETGKYLYCLDNGKGMSKSIIENYLLKIGNSYYQSSEFFQDQAETGFQFAPTSQFGIGILSCYIIGKRIEIVTKEEKGNYIACSIDGLCEYFYYKTPTKEDEDLVRNSGTIVKVYLKKECYDVLNAREIKNIGFVSYSSQGYMKKLRPDLKEDYDNWEHSLYKHLNNYIAIVPEGIEVSVKWENNNNKQKIYSKPYVYESDAFPIVDLEVLDQQINMYGNVCKYSLKDYIGLVECHIFDVTYKGIQYRTILKLPKPGLEQYGYGVMKHIPVCYTICACVEGIEAKANFEIFSFVENLIRHGIVNFCGENRPRLSVDRTEIIKEKDGKYEWIAMEIVRQIVNQAISTAHEHIRKYAIRRGSELYNMVWKSVFLNFNYSSTILIEELSKNHNNHIEWYNLSSFVGSDLTIGDFINSDEIHIDNYDYRKLDSVSQVILLNKLYSASEIDVKDNTIRIRSDNNRNGAVLSFNDEDKAYGVKYVVRTSNHGCTFADYDIISNLYPIVPDYLYDLIEVYGMHESLNDHIKRISNMSNGLSAFYDQNPTEIDEELGLYIEEKDGFGRRDKHIREFKNKRGSLGFFELKIPNEKNEKQTNCRWALTAYIAPRELTEKEMTELAEYKESNPSYYKGVLEGWSIIVLDKAEEKMSTFIKAGKCTRNELVRLIPKPVWEKYKDYIFMFPDGTKINRQ